MASSLLAGFPSFGSLQAGTPGIKNVTQFLLAFSTWTEGAVRELADSVSTKSKPAPSGVKRRVTATETHFVSARASRSTLQLDGTRTNLPAGTVQDPYSFEEAIYVASSMYVLRDIVVNWYLDNSTFTINDRLMLHSDGPGTHLFITATGTNAVLVFNEVMRVSTGLGDVIFQNVTVSAQSNASNDGAMVLRDAQASFNNVTAVSSNNWLTVEKGTDLTLSSFTVMDMSRVLIMRGGNVFAPSVTIDASANLLTFAMGGPGNLVTGTFTVNGILQTMMLAGVSTGGLNNIMLSGPLLDTRTGYDATYSKPSRSRQYSYTIANADTDTVKITKILALLVNEGTIGLT